MTKREWFYLLGLNTGLILMSLFSWMPQSILVSMTVLINLGLMIRLQDGQSQRHQAQLAQTIQETKSHERLTQIQSSQLATIISNLPFATALLDANGRFILSNASFDLLNDNTSPSDYNALSLHEDLRSFIRQSYLKELYVTKNLRVENADYQAIHVPIYDAKRYNGCLIMFLDITQLLEGERIQKRFIADASHELRTPLTSIVGMIEILNRPNFNDDETLLEFLHQIEREAKRMDELLEDLLTLSKQSSQKSFLNLQDYSLSDLTTEAHQSTRSLFETNKVEFMNAVDKGLRITVDADKFHHILTNLFSNAAKFSPLGKVTVTAIEGQQTIEIRITDTGLGIPKADQDRIFDRFYRAEHSRSRSLGGSGLGLAIVKAYVLAHQGTIRVESEPGIGSTFILNLPN